MISIFSNCSKPFGKLQNGRDMAGIELAGSPEFTVGSTVNAGARGKSPELELEEMKKKIAAGTQFFITPPLFDIAAIEPFLKRVDREKTVIIPTVLLLKSLGMARYIARNMKDVDIPDEMIEAHPQSPGQGTRMHSNCGRTGNNLKTGRIQTVFCSPRLAGNTNFLKF